MALSDRGHVTEGDVNESDLRKAWSIEHLDSHTQELLERDESAFLHQSLSTPCLNTLQSAEGSWIEDTEGRRYLDFHGNMVHQIGYAHPKVLAAVDSQMRRMPFCPRRYTNEPAVALAERLDSLCPPNLGKVLFAPGGSAAMGMAIKLARLITGRHKTIGFWDAFHGASLDASSVGGEERFRRNLGPMLPGSEHVPPPDPRRCPLGCGAPCSGACASYLEYVLEREGDVAAVIAEPMRCTTVVPPPDDYWLRIKAACQRHGTLLIFDEIPTGLGRTGKMFSWEWFGAEPDILVLGKGLGGALMPLAAMIVRKDFDTVAEYSIGHYTHEKNPVSCAAGLATLDVIAEESLVERSWLLGEVLLQRLSRELEGHSNVVEIRGRGLLVGVELDSAKLAEKVMYRCLSLGLSFKVSAGTVLTLAPPLNISSDDLETAQDILVSAIQAG